MASDQVTSWPPAASIDAIKLRARMLARIRAFFAERSVLEVDTPALSSAGATDPHLHSFKVCPRRGEAPALYLHTSPEFSMKRLLAAGTGSIYQVCKVFRDREIGRLHNPEFTMIEWYRVGVNYHELMDEVAALVAELLRDHCRLAAPEKLTYREVFERVCGIDPHTASARDLTEVAQSHEIVVTGLSATDRDGWRDLLLTQLVEPHLGTGRLCFVYDFPVAAAALARVRAGQPPIAERFELYLDGIELANGFGELTDATEQRRRFDHDCRRRAEQTLPMMPIDERLIAALEHGLPACSGVALGFDRLVMLAAGAASISEVLAFPIERA